MKVTRFTLNGQEVSVGSHAHLLAALRDELGVVSVKDGCSPSGQCGCCVVHIDGKAVVSCQQTLEKIEGKTIETLEGFDDTERDRYAAAFAASGALQCGFCTPGIIMRTKYLVDKDGPALTRDKAARHLGGHLCRCTGYTKVLDAVESLAKGMDREQVVTQNKVEIATGLGSRAIKYQGDQLALGDKHYVDDMSVDGMLHGAVRLADHARADIVSIDTSAAEAVDGVVRVFTAADVPGELRTGLVYIDWPAFVPIGGRTSYRGDVIAYVVADDRPTARRAAGLVEVVYDVHTPFTDPRVALASRDDAVWGLDGNQLSRSAYTRGDVEAALASSAHVVSERFETQRVEHAFLEPESTLAVPVADDRLVMYSGGQGVWDDRNSCARILGIDPAQIEVHLVSNGGAFGGKEDMSNQGQTALAAWLLKRPVKTTFSREESLFVHAKRHPISIDLDVGCDEHGVLTAVRARMIGDSGPYASVGTKVLERAAGHATGPYVVSNVDVEAIAARTNNPVCGAFRGFGANQAQFAMEGALDRLAAEVDITGWELRSRNVIEPGVIWGPGQIMDEGCKGARSCLDAVKDVYDAARAEGKAVGMGLGLKNSGLGNGFLEIANAVVHFRDDDRVEVRHCWTEMGQGVHTVALQVAVEELGIDPDSIDVHVDTSRELGAGQTTGSRGTVMAAGSVADACRVAIADGCRKGVDYRGEYRIDWTNRIDDPVENPIIHSTFGYAAQVVIADPETGQIETVVAAHDVGRAVNPLLCEGQIEGAVHMGLGYALTEEFPTDDTGTPTNMTFRSLGIIRPKDMPDVDVILVEDADPNSPYGVKGVGEIGLVPTAAAVAEAYRQVDGRWRSRLPIDVHQPLKGDWS